MEEERERGREGGRDREDVHVIYIGYRLVWRY